MIRLNVRNSVLPLKGARPAKNWYRIQPSAHKSEAGPDSLSRSTSGETYSAVPTKVDPCGSLDSGSDSASTRFSPMIFAVPKSASFR